MLDIDNLAPVVLFVFARPEHTQKTLSALAANRFAEHTDLIVFADAPRRAADDANVLKTREVVRKACGFKSVTILERDENFGLARNIIEGVGEVLASRGKVIVLEDDLVTSPAFLEYMNRALVTYRDIKKVWHISGWNYPISAEGLDSAFLWRGMNCWGWATWHDRWAAYKKNPDELLREMKKDDINRFNIDGAYNFWDQVLLNSQGTINTWAIFWYATIFRHDGLCLNPSVSYVDNIGQDGTGENCGKEKLEEQVLCVEAPVSFPTLALEESQRATVLIKRYCRHSKVGIIRRILRAIKKFSSA